MQDSAISKLGITMVSATLILNTIGIAVVHFKSKTNTPTAQLPVEIVTPSPMPQYDLVASGSSQALVQELKSIKDELVKIRAEQRALNQVLGSNISSVDIGELIDNLNATSSSQKP